MVPITAPSYSAGGDTLTIALNFSPAIGEGLTLIENTGLPFIDGEFGNLGHGDVVTLSHGGSDFNFVANYFGGSGNDLVLEWPYRALYGWGLAADGQLGAGVRTRGNLPVRAETTGVLAGKTVIAIDADGRHTLALCSDGTLATWGQHYRGALGNGATEFGYVPALVDTGGVLAGRNPIAISSGNLHSLALCSDGSIVSWGSNAGNLGNGDTEDSPLPVLVDQTGALAGKTVVAVSAAANHSLALCSDGTVYGWGTYAVLVGAGPGVEAVTTPLATDVSGVLAGKVVVAIAVGSGHSLALCSDGTLATWGSNNYGQLGNNTTTLGDTPVAVDQTGVLAGKSVVAMSCGESHSLVLCSDGTLAAWGYGRTGRLGTPDGSFTTYRVPTLVTQDGELAGKTVVAIDADVDHNLVLSADGTVFSWGENSDFQLGDNSNIDQRFPTESSALRSDGAPITEISAGLKRGFANVTTGAPDFALVSPDGTVLNDGDHFDLGSNLLAGVNKRVTFLLRESGGGNLNFAAPIVSGDFSLVGTVPPELLGGSGTPLTVEFAPQSPGAHVGSLQIAITGQAGYSRVLTIHLDATASTETALSASFSSPTDIPLTVGELDATPFSISVSLNFSPQPGTALKVIEIAGTGFISGEFNNLAQGQVVSLEHSGQEYDFVCDYFGGSGNDLVLHWLHTQAFGRGINSRGQLGSGSTSEEPLAEFVGTDDSGVLSGKAITSIVSDGYNSSLALCGDGTLVSWGANFSGSLGDGSDVNESSAVPVEVDRSGVLAGRQVIAIANGNRFSLALCADGEIAAWGRNYSGQLGDNSTTNQPTPVLVDRSGVLAGKKVVAISAGGEHSLALCDDGSIAAWGSNRFHQLGEGVDFGNRSFPVLVDSTNSILNSKRVIAIEAGWEHSLALCDDGTVASWGRGSRLGNNPPGSFQDERLAVAVDQSGVLAGRRVVALSASSNSLALCDDGVLVGWGTNQSGQLGDGTTTVRKSPVLVDDSGALAGKLVVEILINRSRSQIRCADGTMLAWGGYDPFFGNPDIEGATRVPIAIEPSGALIGRQVSAMAGGAGFELVLAGAAPPRFSVRDDVAEIDLGPGDSADLGATDFAGKTGRKTFTLSNTGGVPLINWSASFTGDFRLAQALPVRLEVGQTVPLVVEFAPTSAGLHNGTITLDAETSQGGSPSLSFNLTGTGSGITTLVAMLPNAEDVALTAIGLNASGNTINLGLAFAPRPGQALHVIELTSRQLIEGEFENLAQGQQVTLAFGDVDYVFFANYYGGDGNDLVLVSGDNRIVTWGLESGVGRRTPAAAHTPVAVETRSALLGKEVAEIASSGFYNLVLCSDGSLVEWGTPYDEDFSLAVGDVPRFVDQTGVLAGKTVVAIAASGAHSLVLCSDGTIASWGKNDGGQLGDGNLVRSENPVLVQNHGVLAGRTPIAIAAGGNHSYALCDDGSIAAWGRSGSGQLGSGTQNEVELVPVLVDQSGVLAGKTVTAIGGGEYHGVALCSDGTLASWGSDYSGQLGNGPSDERSLVPVLVDQGGVLAGKNPVQISIGDTSNLALCDDGNIVAWGSNGFGQLGDDSSTDRYSPVLVDRSGSLAGKTVVSVVTRGRRSFALLDDRSLVAWGSNYYGQLGIPAGGVHHTPVAVPASGALLGKNISVITAGGEHSLVLTDDGTLAAWGKRRDNQLGDGIDPTPLVPTYIPYFGALTGKHVLAISAGGAHSIALCSDGDIVEWSDHLDQPIALERGGALTGKTVVAISAGANFSLALTSDGTVATWPQGSPGAVPELLDQTGVLAGKKLVRIAAAWRRTAGLCEDGTVVTWDRAGGDPPELVDQSGVLHGKSVIKIAAHSNRILLLCEDGTLATPQLLVLGNLLDGKVPTAISLGLSHLLVLTEDGTIVASGSNDVGQLGAGSTYFSQSPILVDRSDALAGKHPVRISTGRDHNLALNSDGSVVAWGNDAEEDRERAPINSPRPFEVSTAALGTAVYFSDIAASSYHSVALAATAEQDLTVRQFGGGFLIDGESVAHFGNFDPGASGDQYFAVHNPTSLELAGVELSLDSAGAGNFEIVSAPPSTIAPGATEIFTLRFAPVDDGELSATVRLTSSAQIEALPFEFTITGYVYDVLDLWYFEEFGRTGRFDLGGDANADGENELIEFATAQSPFATGRADLHIVAQPDGSQQFTYLMASDAVGVIELIAEWSDDLSEGSWSTQGVTETVLSDDGFARMIQAQIPAGSGERRFVRLRAVR